MFVLAAWLAVGMHQSRRAQQFPKMNPHVPKLGIELSEYQNLGPLFVGTVSNEWYDVDYPTRIAQLERLQRRAATRGFFAMMLVDPSGRPVARWSRHSGLKVYSRRHPT